MSTSIKIGLTVYQVLATVYMALLMWIGLLFPQVSKVKMSAVTHMHALVFLAMFVLFICMLRATIPIADWLEEHHEQRALRFLPWTWVGLVFVWGSTLASTMLIRPQLLGGAAPLFCLLLMYFYTAWTNDEEMSRALELQKKVV